MLLHTSTSYYTHPTFNQNTHQVVAEAEHHCRPVLRHLLMGVHVCPLRRVVEPLLLLYVDSTTSKEA